MGNENEMKRLLPTTALTLGAIATGCSVGSASPTADPPTAGDGRVCLADPPDDTRCWLELDASDGNTAPLVIDLHGYGQPAAQLRMYSGMEDVAIRERLVMVWPDSPDRSWNDGTCCGGARAEDRDDVAFIGALIDHVRARLPIDPQRVYLTGFSNGCSLAQRVAVRRSALIAAVACYSDYLADEPDAGYEPVPIFLMHGTSDNAVAYEPSSFEPGAIENAAAWARHNDCPSPPAITEHDSLVTYRYVGCRDDADVVHLAVVGGGHVPAPELRVEELLWGFFEQH
jgi:polyhydroxybutyrate depolymerase